MHINTYGIKLFGGEIISIDMVENMSMLLTYDVVIIAKVKPDKNGNGSIEVTILQSNEQPIELRNGWQIVNVRAAWNWNRYHTYIDMRDSYGCDYALNTEYYKSEINGYADMMMKIFNQIMNISHNYDNVIEYKLANPKN